MLPINVAINLTQEFNFLKTGCTLCVPCSVVLEAKTDLVSILKLKVSPEH